MNREQWLQAAAEKLESLFTRQVPDVHVSVGWPSSGGLASKRRTVGQCWAAETSEDGVPHVFISPMLIETHEVLSTLLHELVHATVGVEAKHGGEFITVAKELGFMRPWSSTPESPELLAHLANIAEELPPYPHKALVPVPKTKHAGTRMLKVTCPNDGYTLRTTQKWVDFGLPTCSCGAQMEREVQGD